MPNHFWIDASPRKTTGTVNLPGEKIGLSMVPADVDMVAQRRDDGTKIELCSLSSIGYFNLFLATRAGFRQSEPEGFNCPYISKNGLDIHRFGSRQPHHLTTVEQIVDVSLIECKSRILRDPGTMSVLPLARFVGFIFCFATLAKSTQTTQPVRRIHLSCTDYSLRSR
jgi:hypothetical protein